MMIVCAVIKLPIGNSMLPLDCQNEGKESEITVMIPTEIRVKSQQELYKMMRADEERFAGCGWRAIPEKPEPRRANRKVTVQLDVWGKK